MGLVPPDTQGPLRLRELGPVVDPVERAVVVEAHRAHDSTVLPREADELGQVQLAGGGGRLDGRDAAAQPGAIEGIASGVDLVALQLLGRGVAGLHDSLDRAELAPDNAAEHARLGGKDARQGDRGVVHPALLEERSELGGEHERHVTRQDEDLGRVLDRRQSRPHGIGGAVRCLLEGIRRAAGKARLAQLGGGGGIDDNRSGRFLVVVSAGLGPRVEDIREHRPPAERVEDLRQTGVHPLPEARCKHDRGGASGRVGS